MYEVRTLEPADRALARLPKKVARRIVAKIAWLAENLDLLNPEALTSDLAGLYKLRVGDYRVIYEIVREERVIVVHLIDHRRDVYRRR